MLKVKVVTKNGSTTYTGVLSLNVGSAAIQMCFFGDVMPKKYIPLHRIIEVVETPMTDEDIENCGNKPFIAWYKEQKAKFEAKQAEAAEAEQEKVIAKAELVNEGEAEDIGWVYDGAAEEEKQDGE